MKKFRWGYFFVKALLVAGGLGLIWLFLGMVFAPSMSVEEVNTTPVKLLGINLANVPRYKWNITYKYSIRIVGANLDLERYRSQNPGDVAYEGLPDESRNQFVIMTNSDFRTVLPYIDRFVKTVELRSLKSERK